MVDGVVLGALAAAALGVFLALVVGFWALRKTLSLVRRLIVLGLVGALGFVIIGGALSIYLFR